MCARKHKLKSLHPASVDIGTMNRSRKLMRVFVESMTVVMDRRISGHVRAIDPLTGRKRVFAYIADKVTELHRTGDEGTLLR